MWRALSELRTPWLYRRQDVEKCWKLRKSFRTLKFMEASLVHSLDLSLRIEINVPAQNERIKRRVTNPHLLLVSLPVE